VTIAFCCVVVPLKLMYSNSSAHMCPSTQSEPEAASAWVPVWW
jgi:hypothetical protein